jgi:hypothetical protein
MCTTVSAAVSKYVKARIIQEGSRDCVGLYSIERMLQAIVF